MGRVGRKGGVCRGGRSRTSGQCARRRVVECRETGSSSVSSSVSSPKDCAPSWHLRFVLAPSRCDRALEKYVSPVPVASVLCADSDCSSFAITRKCICVFANERRERHATLALGNEERLNDRVARETKVQAASPGLPCCAALPTAETIWKSVGTARRGLASVCRRELLLMTTTRMMMVMMMMMMMMMMMRSAREIAMSR